MFKIGKLKFVILQSFLVTMQSSSVKMHGWLKNNFLHKMSPWENLQMVHNTARSCLKYGKILVQRRTRKNQKNDISHSSVVTFSNHRNNPKSVTFTVKSNVKFL